MEININIDIDRDSTLFEERGWENQAISRIIKNISLKTACGHIEGKVLDINGNEAGNWKITGL